MTEPQTWTLIGVITAAFASFVGLTVGLIMKNVSLHFASLTSTVESSLLRLRSELRDEMHEGSLALRGEMNSRLDALDRDVQAIAGAVFRQSHPGPSS